MEKPQLSRNTKTRFRRYVLDAIHGFWAAVLPVYAVAYLYPMVIATSQSSVRCKGLLTSDVHFCPDGRDSSPVCVLITYVVVSGFNLVYCCMTK
ncbi:hypothetical protein BDD12DRAFT_838126 [Trichophaea hybrida]|nr:hypothetical protein BDD12DRAFT_838126 [Trichophaea hybrida]